MTMALARHGSRHAMRALTGLLIALASVPSVARAQAAPPPVSPGAVTGLPGHDELQSGAPPSRAPTPAPSRLHVDDTVEHAPCALDAPRYAAIMVRLTQATFANLGPVPAAALDGSWRDYAGTDQPISVLCRIRDRAATTLRAMGYLAAVEVPVQRIADGQVRFEVLYARIVAVRVIGHPGANAALLQRYLARLVDGQVFNRLRAERAVLLARDIPGYDLYLTLKPAGTGAGNMIAQVRVEQTPLELDASVTALGAAATGRFGGQVRATINGLIGMGDQTTLSAYVASPVRRQQIWQVGERVQIGSNGLQLGAHVTYAVTRPSLAGALPPLAAHTWLVDLAASYPLLRHERGDLIASGGIAVVDQDVTFGPLPFSRDRLRVGYLRLDASAHDRRGPMAWGLPLWRLSASVEARHGLGIWGATPDCRSQPARCSTGGFTPPSIAIGDPQATVVRASTALEVNPTRGFSLDTSVRGQVASAPVYAFEQFSLGNYTIGRGYAPGALVGDAGLAFSVDLRGPELSLSHRQAITAQPFVFSDNGWTWRRGGGIPASAALHTLGGGARLALGTMIQIDGSVGVPLTRLPLATRIEPPLFLLTLSTRIWPWRTR